MNVLGWFSIHPVRCSCLSIDLISSFVEFTSFEHKMYARPDQVTRSDLTWKITSSWKCAREWCEIECEKGGDYSGSKKSHYMRNKCLFDFDLLNGFWRVWIQYLLAKMKQLIIVHIECIATLWPNKNPFWYRFIESHFSRNAFIALQVKHGSPNHLRCNKINA